MITDDTATAKCVIGLVYSMASQVKSCAPVVRDMARDIHSHLGDIDQVGVACLVLYIFMEFHGII